MGLVLGLQKLNAVLISKMMNKNNLVGEIELRMIFY